MKRLLVILTSATLASACNSDSAPTQDEYDDVAQAIGTTTASGGDVGSLADSASIATGDMPEGLTLSANGHVTGQHFGLTFDYQLSCRDQAGQTQAGCNDLTDSADLDVSWSGSLSLPRLQASVERTGDWSVTGLQGATATFNGEGTFQYDVTVQSLFRQVTAAYHLDYAASYAAILLDSARRPIGGTATFDISAEHMVTVGSSDSDRSFTIHAVVSFNADHTATVTLDGSHRYHLDIGTGTVSRS